MVKTVHMVSDVGQRTISALGSLAALVIITAPIQVFAQCTANVTMVSDGVDSGGIPDIPDYLYENLPASVNWTVSISAGGPFLLEVPRVYVPMTCFNNGVGIPCENGNDAQAGNLALTPLQYNVGTVGGDCGATLMSITAGIVVFDLPPAVLGNSPCTISFTTTLVDRGIDNSPNLITPAVKVEGTCLAGSLEASTSGSAVVEIIEASQLENIFTDGFEND